MEAAAEGAADAGERRPPRKGPPRAAKKPLAELEVGSTVEGTIRSVQSYGAFVDLGYVTDGLLHVSQMADTFVKDASEMFKVGDSVSVRVLSVDLEKKQVALSRKSENASQDRTPRERKPKADLTEYESADEKEFIAGTVNSIQSYGAFVTLKEGVDGLIHISQIQDGGVSSVEDVLTEGQEVKVRVVSFDAEKRRIGLSMRPWVEGGSQEEQRPRRGGGNRFDEAGEDEAFKLNAEDLAALTVDFEDGTPDDFSVALETFSAEKEAVAAGTREATRQKLQRFLQL